MRNRTFNRATQTASLTTLAIAMAMMPTLASGQTGPGQASVQAAPGQASSTTGDEAPNRVSDTIAADSGVAAPAETQVGDDIVVTAQKRSERLVQVPVAVTAVTGDSLASQQIFDTASLVRTVPSLTFQAGNNPVNSGFRIRGVGTQLFGQGVESAVSVVVDGVVAPRQSAGFTDLADIERIEVLRGPQGTLFGKNATAGVISVVTARPSSTFGGRFDVTAAEGDEYRAKGTITGPITDTLRARLTGFYNTVGGNLYNVDLKRDTNDLESWGVRGKLEWEPTSTLTFLLAGDYRKSTLTCCSRVPVSIVTPAIRALLNPAVVPSPENRDVSNDDLSFQRIQAHTVSLQGDLDLGFATLTSITAYQHWQLDGQFEPDGLKTDPLRYVGNFAYSQWNQNANQSRYNNFTQELRLGSNGSSDLTYVIGAFYSHLDLDASLQRRRLRCAAGTLGSACTGRVTADSSGFDGNLITNNVAVFGQVDWRIAGGLHLLGGLRGQHEKQTSEGRVFGPLVAGDTIFPGTTPNSGSQSRSDSALTGKAGARYEFNRNLQTYASYTRGYKAFALDIDATTNFANQRGLDPEHVNAYELGVKWHAPRGMFDINAALFRSDFTNLQVQAIVQDAALGIFQTIQLNAGKSRSQGLELEATMHPSRDFSVAANFTLIDAKIDVSGQTCPLQLQAGVPVLTGNFPVNSCYIRRTTVNGVSTNSSAIIDVVGGQLPATPRYRVGITPRYDHDFGGFGAFAQVSLNYQSDSIFSLSQDPLLKQAGYAIVDASIGFHDPSSRYNLTLFVKNAFDQTYYTQLNHGTILANAANPLDLWANVNKDADRYFGATFGVKF